MKTDILRKKYLDFFKNKKHKIFPSDSLVPDDPSVLFTSAGMNQFKPYFLGDKKDVKRAVSVQKCLRTGDLEQVGRTAFHHTFFEMLGNFSFGDYFKKEAIELAWEFITNELNIKKEVLWVSVYVKDEEAYEIWKNHIQLPQERIVKLGEDKNFWPANAPTLGPDGPCGPCSEIFFDKGKSHGCLSSSCSPACDCGRFVEFWNLVFTQYDRAEVNKLNPLPQKNIDTGMGLERMAAILQRKDSNFEIDILQPAVDLVRKILKIKTPDNKAISLINAIVDHARAATFAVCDGVYPSNEDRGYVIRKVIRKALYNAYILGCKDIFLYKTVDLYAKLMHGSYPEIEIKKDIIAKVIRTEEEKFISSLKDSQAQFFLISENLKKESKNIIPAQDLFRLYDTYGLPLELSKDMAVSVSLEVDEAGFNNLLAEQKERSRKSSMFDTNIFKAENLGISGKSEFIGYETLETKSKITHLFKIVGSSLDKKETDCLHTGEEGLVVADKSCFYPESGGQLTDNGIIKTKDGIFSVEKVFKAGEIILHKGKVTSGTIDRKEAMFTVNVSRRQALKRAHTATHLLQAALRRVLGEHVAQQGSLVDEDRFRFDFTHFTALTSDELQKIENYVNEYILNADKVVKEELSYEQSKRSGALAFFKDKYKDTVRVVSVGDYSKELCAGTHLDLTSEVGMFLIVNESSISSGIRRIEAVVGKKAYERISDLKNTIATTAGTLKCSAREVPQAVAKLQEEMSELLAKIKHYGKEMVSSKLTDILKEKQTINGFNILVKEFENMDQASLVSLSDILKAKSSPIFVFLISITEGKKIFVCSVTEEYIAKGVAANKFVLEFGSELFLKGGGRGNLVQGVITKKEEGLTQKVQNCFSKFVQK